MDRLRASEIYADDELRIIAIESVRCRARKFAGIYQLYASIEATALVVCAAGASRLLSLTGLDTSLEMLQREVPGLRALLPAVESQASGSPATPD